MNEITSEQASKAAEDSGLGELLHTAWRKGTDDKDATAIWRSIDKLEPAVWDGYVETVAYYLLTVGWRAPA